MCVYPLCKSLIAGEDLCTEIKAEIRVQKQTRRIQAHRIFIHLLSTHAYMSKSSIRTEQTHATFTDRGRETDRERELILQGKPVQAGHPENRK